MPSMVYDSFLRGVRPDRIIIDDPLYPKPQSKWRPRPRARRIFRRILRLARRRHALWAAGTITPKAFVSLGEKP